MGNAIIPCIFGERPICPALAFIDSIFLTTELLNRKQRPRPVDWHGYWEGVIVSSTPRCCSSSDLDNRLRAVVISTQLVSQYFTEAFRSAYKTKERCQWSSPPYLLPAQRSGRTAANHSDRIGANAVRRSLCCTKLCNLRIDARAGHHDLHFRAFPEKFCHGMTM